MENVESTVSKILGENVQKYRKNLKLTQKQLADKIGISQKHLSDIETGTKFPSSGIIDKLSKELNVHISLLFGGGNIYDAANIITNLVMTNLNPRINIIMNDLEEIKQKLKNTN